MGVNSAFKFVPGGSLPFPGVCNSCGSPNRDCITWGPSRMYNAADNTYGALLVCRLCVVDAVLSNPELGMMQTLEHDRVIDSVMKDNAALSVLHTVIGEFRESVLHLTDELFDSLSSITPSSPVEDKGSEDGALESKELPKINSIYL